MAEQPAVQEKLEGSKMNNRQIFEMQLAMMQAERDAALGMVAEIDFDLMDSADKIELLEMKLTARNKIIANLQSQIAALHEALDATNDLLMPSGELEAALERLFSSAIDAD